MHSDPIRVFIGFDQEEALAYHVCCQSILSHATRPIEFHPLAKQFIDPDGRKDGSNAFQAYRYLVPLSCNFQGWAIFIDGDMVLDTDIAALWDYKDSYFNKALAVVKHDYKTRHHKKYIGSRLQSVNTDYPRKNWTSVMLFNCAHYANRILTEEYVRDHSLQHLHRLEWIDERYVAPLPADWNYLVGEDPPSGANLYHFTLGVPALDHYADWHGSWKWHCEFVRMMQCAGEDPVDISQRATERVGNAIRELS